MTDIDILGAAYAATQLAKKLEAAYWTDDIAPERSAILTLRAQDEFAHLVKCMGYTVSKLEGA